MNRVIAMGNLTKAIEIRQTSTGVAVANFTLAVKREAKNKDGEYESDFINCIAFGNQADMMSKYFDKGNKVAIEGHIQSGSYEKEGKKVYTTDVVVEKIHFVESKQAQE